jgi:hypothetical protein
MVYLYDACDQISDFCHQVTEKNATKNILDGRKDRGKTVYPPPPSGSGGIIIGINTTNIELILIILLEFMRGIAIASQ